MLLQLPVIFLVSELLLAEPHVMLDHVLPGSSGLEIIDKIHPWPGDPQLIGDGPQGIWETLNGGVFFITIVTKIYNNHLYKPFIFINDTQM